MPLHLDVQREMTARSARVKSVDFHPRSPWLLTGLHNGQVFIWNYETQTMVKTIDASADAIRSARFAVAKQWIICGGDDATVRVYNYNTMERVAMFQAHDGSIRAIAVHPTLPYVLTAGDDRKIRLWNWDKNWDMMMEYDGHYDLVMSVEWNPKDATTFCSASLDRTVKVWGVTSPIPHFTLEGHTDGVNSATYHPSTEHPYIASAADDFTVKIWDYQSRTCVSTLAVSTTEPEPGNVSSVCFHPDLPLLITGSEDGNVKLWHTATFRLEETLRFGMARAWALACLPGSRKLAIGYDDGTVVARLGSEDPVASLDLASGKVVWVKNTTLLQTRLRDIDPNTTDGERYLPSAGAKEAATTEIYPSAVRHAPNGRFVAVCGDGEYVIYTALTFATHHHGQAKQLAWCAPSAGLQFATGDRLAALETPQCVRILQGFASTRVFCPAAPAEGIFGGHMLAVTSAEAVDFYDWDGKAVVQRIEVAPREVLWSESGHTVALVCEESVFILRHNKALVEQYLTQGTEIPDEGIEGAFELEQEVEEAVTSGCFVGESFLFTTKSMKLQYTMAGGVQVCPVLTKPFIIFLLSLSSIDFISERSRKLNILG